MSPHRTPRVSKRSSQKRQSNRQWIGFWIVLAISVSTLVAIAFIVNSG